jgi:hypothetical protein
VTVCVEERMRPGPIAPADVTEFPPALPAQLDASGNVVDPLGEPLLYDRNFGIPQGGPSR